MDKRFFFRTRSFDFDKFSDLSDLIYIFAAIDWEKLKFLFINDTFFICIVWREQMRFEKSFKLDVILIFECMSPVLVAWKLGL